MKESNYSDNFLNDDKTASNEEDQEFAGDVNDHKPSGPLSKLPALKYITPSIVIFIIFYIFSFVFYKYPLGSYLWVSGESVFINKEIWRPLTAIFVHGDLQHLLSNTPLFLIFGWMLRAYFGFIVFPLSSLLIGILSNVTAVLYYDNSVRIIGASGMVYGMAAQWLVYYAWFDKNHTLSKRIFRSLGFSMAMLFPTTVSSDVSYAAHAAGFISGLIVSIMILPMVKTSELDETVDLIKS